MWADNKCWRIRYTVIDRVKIRYTSIQWGVRWTRKMFYIILPNQEMTIYPNQITATPLKLFSKKWRRKAIGRSRNSLRGSITGDLVAHISTWINVDYHEEFDRQLVMCSKHIATQRGQDDVKICFLNSNLPSSAICWRPSNIFPIIALNEITAKWHRFLQSPSCTTDSDGQIPWINIKE